MLQVVFVSACVISAHLWITTLPKPLLKQGTLAHKIAQRCLAADRSNLLVTFGLVEIMSAVAGICVYTSCVLCM